jgi:hypothetical protein
LTDCNLCKITTNCLINDKIFSFDYSVGNNTTGYHNSMYIEGGFTLYLNNFDKSQIKVNNLNITANDTIQNLSVEEKQFSIITCDTPIINGVTAEGAVCMKDIFSCYKYHKNYKNSDFYSFMVSMMQNEEFYEQVMNSDKLINLWDSMWLPEQIPTHENLQKMNIQDILNNKWLRKNILETMFHFF